MRAWFAERDISLPATPAPAGKAAATAQDQRILGDGYTDGEVDFWDVWVLWAYLTKPRAAIVLDLDLLDIDRDGTTDWIDLGLLGDYLYGSGANPHGIGQPLGGFSVTLTPSLDSRTIRANGSWHRFTVNVTPSTARVDVKANWSTLGDGSFETSSGSSRPSTNRCPPERTETRYGLRDGDTLWLAGCTSGWTSLLIEDRSNRLDNWEILGTTIRPASTTTSTSGAQPGFQIDLVYSEDFHYAHKIVVQKMADRWEKVITEDVPDRDYRDSPLDLEGDHSNAATWIERHPFLEGLVVDDLVDDIVIYVGYLSEDVDYVGSAGALWVRVPSEIPIVGAMSIARSQFRDGTGRDTTLHEIAHALGFGGMWEDLALEAGTGDQRHFTGERARSAFDAEGGWRYTDGPKVPLEAYNNHWRSSVFGKELMGPYVNLLAPLSRTTIQAFADMGYQVDPSQADDYSIPAASTKPVAAAAQTGRCGFMPLLYELAPQGS